MAKQISGLPPATQANLSDLFETSQVDIASPTGYETAKVTNQQIAALMASALSPDFQSLVIGNATTVVNNIDLSLRGVSPFTNWCFKTTSQNSGSNWWIALDSASLIYNSSNTGWPLIYTADPNSTYNVDIYTPNFTRYLATMTPGSIWIFLVVDLNGSPSVFPINISPNPPAVNTYTTSSTLTLSDLTHGVTVNSASAVTLSVPSMTSLGVSGAPGFFTKIGQLSTGQISVAPAVDSGVMLQPAARGYLSSYGQSAITYLWQVGQDNWLYDGDVQGL